MFTQYLKTLDDVLAEARNSKHVTQSEYFPIYSIIEDYVKKNNLIMSNAETLAEKKETTKRLYVIYGENIFRHANNLVNEIAKTHINIVLYTQKRQEHFIVKLLGFEFMQLFNMPSKLQLAILPVRISGIQMFPPEFELIDIYHKLYSPVYVSDWDSLRGIESVIYKQMMSRKIILGGYDKKQFKQPVDNKIILNWLKTRHDYILIGINAVNILKDSNYYHQKIQVIIDSEIDKFVSELDNVIFQYTGFHTTHKMHNVNIFIEPRLLRMAISITIPSNGKMKTIHLMDIFNAAQFELIPYTVYDDLNIGYVEVIRMFMLIDLWIFRILYAMSIINEHTLKQVVDDIFRYIQDTDNIEISKYSTEMYLGTFIDLKIFRKKQTMENRSDYPYYPERYRYQNGDYRKI